MTAVGCPLPWIPVAVARSVDSRPGRCGLCFGLDLADQARSGFRYDYSVYQVEYSRNLLFASAAVMERVFDTVVDRTRSRLDVPTLRPLFGVGHRPHRKAGSDLSPRPAVVIEKPRWNLTMFKVHFGLLTGCTGCGEVLTVTELFGLE
jgi:hypothetical protein